MLKIHVLSFLCVCACVSDCSACSTFRRRQMRDRNGAQFDYSIRAKNHIHIGDAASTSVVVRRLNAAAAAKIET